MKYFAVIVAGGSGNRMGTEVPKQFLLLSGKPVIMHTLEAFYSSDLHPEIILVLNDHFHSFWNSLCKEHNFQIPHQLVSGGEERFHSVKRGLEKVTEDSVVAIHDAVRPLISNQLITQCFLEGENQGAVICGVPSKDSVRQLTDNGSFILDRKTIYLIQTPQAFRYEVLKEAYEQPYVPEFTDDASVVEKTGKKIHILKGESTNIKITFPEDLLLAELLLNKKIRP